MANVITPSVKSQSDLFRLFRVLDIPDRVSGSILSQFFKWLKNNGPEWTISRINEFHELAKHLVGRDSLYRIPSKARIACHADGMPKGPFKWVLQAAKSSAVSDRKLDSIFSVLKMSTGITLGSETPKQLKKFLNAVENPKPDKSNWEWNFVENYGLGDLETLWRHTSYDSLEKWTSTPRKRCLHFEPGKNSYLGSVREVGLALDQHRWDAMLLSPSTITRFFSLYQSSLGRHGFLLEAKKLLDESLVEVMFDSRREDTYLLNFLQARDPVVGKIGIIQERGGKARIVANPLRVHQVALSRLNNWLEKVSEKLPWDCTDDQGKGVRWMQKKLAEGHTLVTADLTSFTDQFPLEIVTSYLKLIGPKDPEFLAAVDLQHHISREGSWYFQSKLVPSKSFVTWTKGIPLGALSCFRSAGQTHGMILRTLELRRGLEDCFVVLGDDVVLTKVLAKYYEDITSQMGCPCNQKGLTSDTIGEFASKLACKERIIRSPKLPKGEGLFRADKPLDLLQKYGPKAIALVPSRFREMVSFFASFPKEFGGLGWKPPKNTFTDSKVLSEHFYKTKRKAIHDILPYEQYKDGKSFVIYRKRLSDRLLELESSFGYLPVKAKAKSVDLDKLSKALKTGLPDVSVLDKIKKTGTSWTCKEPMILSLVRKEQRLREAQAQRQESDGIRSEDGLPSVDLQWQILHVNSSLDDPLMEKEHLLLEDKVKDYPSVSRREFSLEPENQNSYHAKFTRRRTAALSTLKSAITGYAMIPWLAFTSLVSNRLNRLKVLFKPKS